MQKQQTINREENLSEKWHQATLGIEFTQEKYSPNTFIKEQSMPCI